ncbi:MAG: bi-domain-containing oxidoreductase [Steroidobacteraceae bacterium]
MKQVFQDLKTGSTYVLEVPTPNVEPGKILIRTKYSLISSGTERMLVEFGKASLVEKVRQQPEKAAQVIAKIKTDGVLATMRAVDAKLSQPMPLGYCNSGEVVAVGKNVRGYSVGDRVVSNGRHAEFACVPSNLCAKLPGNVAFDEAPFAVLGAIALQGIRLISPTLGENIVVFGLGLIGLMAVQILRANGCRVLGLDFNQDRLRLAQSMGCTVIDLSSVQDPIQAAIEFSRDRGVDAALLTLATKSSEPIAQSAKMLRKRGRIVLVGVAGTQLSRDDFYEKELSFQVSCSYGPGRYDITYEEQGHDYPYGLVRWTEQRNFEAVLDLMSSGSLCVSQLVSSRFEIDRAPEAYNLIASDEPALGVLLQFDSAPLLSDVAVKPIQKLIGKPREIRDQQRERGAVGIIGAGNYAASILIPAFKMASAELAAIGSRGGANAGLLARRFGIERATAISEDILNDHTISSVVIATRHDSHAELTCAALNAGKNVFVEKPLCISLEQLEQVALAEQRSTGILMVGFNRRFAPQIVEIKRRLVDMTSPKAIVMTVNAGSLAGEHWTRDSAIGGGRLVGEACHFIDLMRFLVDQPIVAGDVQSMGSEHRDTFAIQLHFADKSLGTINYFSNGHRAVPKERVEIFIGGRVCQLENFRRLNLYGFGGRSQIKAWRQDKGQVSCAKAFMNAVRHGLESPIRVGELLEVSRISIELQAQIAE